MLAFRIVLNSTSNKKMDQTVAKIITTARKSLAVVAGPVPFKNRRLLDIYPKSFSRTVDDLHRITIPEKVHVEISTFKWRLKWR